MIGSFQDSGNTVVNNVDKIAGPSRAHNLVLRSSENSISFHGKCLFMVYYQIICGQFSISLLYRR